MKETAVLFGSALAMELVTERNLLAQYRRHGPPSLSSMHGLNVHMGRYDQLYESDFLNSKTIKLSCLVDTPDFREECGIHAYMQKKLGL